MNSKFFQLQGPFSKNINLIDVIKLINSDFTIVKRIGIQTKEGNKCRINNNEFEIGKTGSLEFSEVEIKSLIFPQDEDKSALIDCVLE